MESGRGIYRIPRTLLGVSMAACLALTFGGSAWADDGTSAVSPLLESGQEDIPGNDITWYSSPLTGSIDTNSSDQRDIYGVPLEAGEQLIAALSGDQGIDFDLYLYDPFAVTIADTAHVVASSLNTVYPESFIYTSVDDVDRFGNHELMIQRGSGLAAGNWSLLWQIISNDTLVGNGPPPAVTNLDGRLELFDDENDAFRVYLEKGWRIVSTLRPWSSDFDPDLFLLPPGSTDIDAAGVARSEQPPGVWDRIDHTAGTSGSYYINPWAGNFGTGGNYTLYHTVLSEEAGRDRYATCAEASRRGWQNETSDNVVIATGLNWPDALGGAAIAGALDCPILIVKSNEIPAAVLGEIRTLGAEHAVILGGRDVVGRNVEEVLTTEGLTFERLAGDTRYETAELAAEYAVDAPSFWDGTAFIATGLKFPDALAASPISAKQGYPIFLEGRNGLSDSTLQTMERIGVQRVVLLGQSDVVSTATEELMRSELGGPNVRRLGGNDRYKTAADIVTWAIGHPANMDVDQIAIATGENFPDALSGGPMQARANGVLLLTRGGYLSGEASAFLDAHSDECAEIVFLGGTDIVTPTARTSVADLMGRP